MRAAIYARVSTDRQGRDQTIDSQLEALAAWVTAHGHDLKDTIYIDEGYSGARLDRPALDRLRDAAARASSTSSASTAPTAWPAATPTRSCCWRSSARPAATSSSSSGPSPTTRTTSSCSRSRGPSPSTREPSSPSGSAAASSRRPGPASGAPAAPLRLPLRPQAGRRPRAPRGRRGRGRGRADALSLADRRADDRTPDPQAAGRGPVAAAERQAALVERRRAPHPLRPALRRDCVRQPQHPRTAPQAPVHRPAAGLPTCRQHRPREEWIPIPVPAIIDESTHQHAADQLARNSALSFRNNTRNDYLLRCLLTCRTCGLCDVRRHHQRGRRAAGASLLQVLRPRAAVPRPPAPMFPVALEGRRPGRGRVGPRPRPARRTRTSGLPI